MRRVLAIILTVVLAVGINVAAQDKPAEKAKVKALTDYVEVVLRPGADKSHAVAEVSAGNVNPLRILSLPFKFDAGGDSVWIDSISYAGTRVEYYDSERRQDSLYAARSAVLLLLLSPHKDKKYLDLQPGSGLVARIYFAVEGTFPLDKFQMTPVTLPPNNKFMYVTDSFAGAEPTYSYKVAEKEKEAKANKTE